MSLPPGFIDELRGRLSLGQVAGRKLSWDSRKSNPGKGDFWAQCPFHQEKSASFHVDDRKGFYYCFGCHASGDAITFVRETENVSFLEAVGILAAEAGMPVPASDPRAQEQADRRTRLVQVMELAVQHYRLQLRTGAAAQARAYLAGRGLSEAALSRWEIGFAPMQWQGLFDALTAKGVSTDLLVEAGLCKPSEKRGGHYDFFRDRILFPIRDGRGRAIAFGGRAMQADEKAKYLNSPETPLFDKGRSLFNHGPAREAAGKGQPLIVAEGYMDVIALAEAGFDGAVAPLGTAMTEDQLRLLWRIAPEPVIALDGDRAGLAAAMRLIDLALPLLDAGQALRFAIMPQGLDPDDLVRSQGAGAMRKVLDEAVPMVRLLWQRETEGRDFDSPERRAALDKALRDRIATIRNPSIRAHYETAIRELVWQMFGRKPGGQAGKPKVWNPGREGGREGGRGGRRGGWEAPPVPMPATRASMLAAAGIVPDHLREAVILAILISNPAILPAFESEIERLQCADPAHEALRRAILRLGHGAGGPSGAEDFRAGLAAEVGGEPLEKLLGQSHVAITPAVRRPGDPELARMCLAEELAKLNARRGHAREIAEAVEDLAGVADEGLTWRLGQAALALDRAGRGDGEDRTEYDTGSNGARMNKEERGAFEQLLGRIDFAKGKPGPGA